MKTPSLRTGIADSSHFSRAAKIPLRVWGLSRRSIVCGQILPPERNFRTRSEGARIRVLERESAGYKLARLLSIRLLDTPQSAKVRAIGASDVAVATAEGRKFSDEYKAETVRLI